MPPFLGTDTTWAITKRTRSIHAMAAPKEKPATTKLPVWVVNWEETSAITALILISVQKKNRRPG